MILRPLRSGVFLAVLLQLGCAHLRAGDVVKFPDKQDTLLCTTNGNCSVRVFARIGPNQACEVMPEFETVRVSPGKTPNMRWDIESIDTGHRYKYRFEFRPTEQPPVYGIQIRNNTAQDFDTPSFGRDAQGREDKAKFTWMNKHMRALPLLPFDYDIKVERSLRDQDNWSRCTPLDPRIVNE